MEKQKLISNILLINSGEAKENILNILKNTDNDILKHIFSITVHNASKLPETIINIPAWGAATSYFLEDKYVYTKIDIVSGIYHTKYDLTFDFTLKHEIGHVKGAMSGIFINSKYNEDYADDYANLHTIIPPEIKHSMIDKIFNTINRCLSNKKLDVSN